METPQDILKRYLSQAETISSQQDFELLVIIPAMEYFAAQQARLAFDAARQQELGKQHTFEDYQSYQNQHQLSQELQQGQDEKAEAIKMVADAILPQYIPADTTIQTLTFNFKADGNSYTVTYIKDQEGYWQFDAYTDEKNITN